MRNIFIIVIICYYLIGCNHNSLNNSDFILVEPLKHYVDSFIAANPKKDVYELYINKVDPDSTVIILYAGKRSFTSEENKNYNQAPIIQVKSNGILVDVYSGLERYVKNTEMLYDTNKRIGSSEHVYGLIFDNKGKLIWKNRDVPYPFLVLPVETSSEYFSPLVIIKDSIN